MNARRTCEKEKILAVRLLKELTDRREQVTTWRDLRELFWSHSGIVFLLFGLNCIEL
jgi:hypothetical protein